MQRGTLEDIKLTPVPTAYTVSKYRTYKTGITNYVK